MKIIKNLVVTFIIVAVGVATVACGQTSAQNSAGKSVLSARSSVVSVNGKTSVASPSAKKSSPSASQKQSPSQSAPKSAIIETPVENPTATYVQPLNGGDYQLVKTVYQTVDTVICDKVVSADATGMIDATNQIQFAIDQVANLGGGTVFLPVGKYLVTDTINLPAYVTLRGDWQCPQGENLTYGTIILAKPSVLGTSKPQDKPLFNLSGNSAINGLTFYYPDQTVENVKQYGYTIYADQPVTTTIKNVTFINSAYGVGVSLNKNYNELVNINNLYGTFLYNAIAHNATTDVGFFDNVNISTQFWQNADAGLSRANGVALNSFVKNNLNALVLGDLDDQLISNLTIDGAKRGITFTTGIREGAGFWGLVNNAQITNAETGVYSDFLNSRSGVVFTASNLGRVENNSPVGAIKLCNVTSQNFGSGKTLTESGQIDLSGYITRLNPTFIKAETFKVANLTSGGNADCTAQLNTILSTMPSGSVLVVPNGVYRLNGKVSVPNGVELRSSQGEFARTNQSQNGKNGVVFVTYASGNTFELGAGAGIRGVRVWHAKNDFLTAKTALDLSSNINDVTVKALGADCYAVNNETVGAYCGFDFTASNNHKIVSNYGISYRNFIKAGGENGVIMQCLSNPNFMTRTNLYNFFGATDCNVGAWERIRNSGESNQDFALLRDDLGRTHTTMVLLENATNQRALNVFCYGESCLFNVKNSTGAVLVNTSLDYIPNDKYVYKLNGGSMVIVGSLRVYGISLLAESGTLQAYGRIAFGVLKEKGYNSAVNVADEIEYVSASATKKMLFDCDSKPSGFNLEQNSNSAFVKQGTGSWKMNAGANVSGAFTATDVSAFSGGYLHLWIYCQDVSKMGEGQIELTSSGTCDQNELNWSLGQAVTKSGWNELWLELSSGGSTGGTIDFTKVNYLRIYNVNSQTALFIDGVEFITD